MHLNAAFKCRYPIFKLDWVILILDLPAERLSTLCNMKEFLTLAPYFKTSWHLSDIIILIHNVVLDVRSILVAYVLWVRCTLFFSSICLSTTESS